MAREPLSPEAGRGTREESGRSLEEAATADAEPAGQAEETEPGPARFELTTSRQFESWLAETGASLAFTTYQAGMVFFLGLDARGRLSVFNRLLRRCMGMTAAGRSLYVSTLYEILRFENALAPGQASEGYDAVFVPQPAATPATSTSMTSVSTVAGGSSSSIRCSAASRRPA